MSIERFGQDNWNWEYISEITKSQRVTDWSVRFPFGHVPVCVCACVCVVKSCSWCHLKLLDDLQRSALWHLTFQIFKGLCEKSESCTRSWRWKWRRSVVSDSSRPHGLQPTRLPRPWDSPGKSTGVGCHCLLHNIALSIIKYLLIKQWSMKNNATIYLLGWPESTHWKPQMVASARSNRNSHWRTWLIIPWDQSKVP